MKKYISILLMMLSIMSAASHSYAAFPVQSKSCTTTATHAIIYQHWLNHSVPRRREDGGLGTTAFVFGILSVTMMPILSIPAIIFGAIGQSGGRENAAMARAGMILGIISLSLMILIFLLLFHAI